MTEDEKLIREWEKRYDSYILYRTQYLNLISICLIIIGVILSVALRAENVADTVINGLLMLGIVILIGTFYAHIIVLNFLKKLSSRITEIEIKLSINKFDTVMLLKQAVLFTKYVSLLGIITVFTLLILFNLGILKI